MSTTTEHFKSRWHELFDGKIFVALYGPDGHMVKHAEICSLARLELVNGALTTRLVVPLEMGEFHDGRQITKAAFVDSKGNKLLTIPWTPRVMLSGHSLTLKDLSITHLAPA